MKLATNEAEVLARVLHWAESDKRVRAVLLTSTRAVANASLDTLSDYDVVLLAANPEDFARETEWVSAIGTPLLRVQDAEVEPAVDLAKQNVMILYEDGTKIDYSIWPLTLSDRLAELGALPGEFDGGYRVLLDKDGFTASWPLPTHTAYIPAKPTAAEFQSLVEEFWFVTTYVAKYLWREEFIPSKVIFDYELKYLILRRLLEWRVAIARDWSVQPGFFGRGMQRVLDAETWQEFEATYVGPDREDNWAALFRTIDLFRDVATGVAGNLGFTYPHDLDARMIAYLRGIQQLPPRSGE